MLLTGLEKDDIINPQNSKDSYFYFLESFWLRPLRQEPFMKYSKQRELILHTVLENPIHPTADTVYEQVRQVNPRISLGTVYRNLNFLSELGILKKISMPVGSDRFDGRLDDHYHMICDCCGQVFDVECDALQELDSQIMHLQGFQVLKHHLILSGICRDCRESQGKMAAG
jgi:Fe2+ or Zn2+ uptake regulation protein